MDGTRYLDIRFAPLFEEDASFAGTRITFTVSRVKLLREQLAHS